MKPVYDASFLTALTAEAFEQHGEQALILSRAQALEGAPGPALLLTPQGELLAHNEAAAALLEFPDAVEALMRLAQRAAACNEVLEIEKIVGRLPHRHFILRARPVAMATGSTLVWIDGIDTTVKDHVIEGLRESRALFKALVEAVSDLSWATDMEGRFSFVSGAEMLGYEPWEMNARLSSEFGPEAGKCFQARTPVSHCDIWLPHKDGSRVCFDMAAEPVMVSGEWVGARGVGRIVTEARLAEARLHKARQREALFQRLLDAIRGEADPVLTLTRAVQAIRENFAADRCILQRAAGTIEEGRFRRGARVVTANCIFRGVVVGEIAVERGGLPWSQDDRVLIERLADSLAIAIAQAEQVEMLATQSLTDMLTGLANRRAFEQGVERQLAALGRSPGQAVLALIDLDHFKQVNDTQGHDVGDLALRACADILRNHVRQSDMAARLGGDEFAIWLDESSIEGALRVSLELLAAMQSVREKISGSQLSLSIGLARWTGPEDTLGVLLRRADESLYVVKRAGRNGVAVHGEDAIIRGPAVPDISA